MGLIRLVPFKLAAGNFLNRISSVLCVGCNAIIRERDFQLISHKKGRSESGLLYSLSK